MWLLRVLRLGEFLTPYVPAPVGYAICWLIGLILCLANLPARRNVLRNLRHVLPHASWLRLRWETLRVFVTVVTNYYDLLRLGSVDRDRVPELFVAHGWQHLDAALARGKGVIILSAHVGNFNVVASYPAALGYRSGIIAERLYPAPLFDYVSRLRSALGVAVISPGAESLRPIVRLLRENGILLVAGDRNVAGEGPLLPFFGEPASLPIGPVIVAMRTGAALVPAYTIRRPGKASLVEIEPAIELVRTGNREADIAANAALMVAALERMISRDPGQWSVLQPVWPETRGGSNATPRASDSTAAPRQRPAGRAASTTR